eukprot:Protomagalhaensia_sp_Gyna_25__5057@NODE_56_length_5952_cov_234_277524_g41_i0_p1_GENE_NODE_56_length_5952_cov_234_277524_g41_i0NODE_56_length_5952_cov_234_277524_g41_i0_p1_ORF_typecomplete_len442_score36_03DMT_YdcZ/PF04657_13/1_2e15DMT_YdcZ/PF04657_13/5_9e20EamA/PF00892_20/0_0025EamA/PF00892_20/2_5e027TMRDISM_7TM/PF07695_11/2e037TMRDISM_7TM/PF07695_11/0_0977TMRDISM_7TM/PF07695_11/1_2Phage_holin_1/PF04531_13/1_4e03Phage_holin_1/PF04531_13/6_2e03Phage_holin_1/PF04531_13/1_2e03Phage_holin_1/PF04531_
MYPSLLPSFCCRGVYKGTASATDVSNREECKELYYWCKWQTHAMTSHHQELPHKTPSSRYGSSISLELAAHQEHSFTTATNGVSDLGTERLDHPQPSNPTLWLQYLEFVFPLSAGGIIPITGALNSVLSDATHSVFLITVLTYGIAGLVTLGWAACTGRDPPIRDGVQNVAWFVRSRWFNFFVLLGGVLGACQHLTLTVITGELGSSLYVVGAAFGQILGSILLDTTGFAWARRHRVSKLTLLGCVVVCTGIVVHKSKVLHPENEAHLSLVTKILLICMTFIQGVTTCMKSSIGGELSELLGRHRRATCYSFVTGCACMALAAAVYNKDMNIGALGDFSISWRLFGALGTIYVVAVLFIFQRRLSSAITYCCLIVGQMLSSTILDLTGWLGVSRRPFETVNAIGITIFMLGIVLSTYGRMRRFTVNKSAVVMDPLPSEHQR